jgi:hypothetical protein
MPKTDRQTDRQRERERELREASDDDDVDIQKKNDRDCSTANLWMTIGTRECR